MPTKFLFMVIVNGAHGIGKSTLAELLHADFPMSYLISITNIRNGFSQFEFNRSTTIKKTLVLAQKMSKHLLQQGTPVIVEGVFRASEIKIFKKIAKENSAVFYHFILQAPLKTVLQRADKRGYKSVPPGGMIRAKIISFYNDFDSQKEGFGSAIRVPTEHKTTRKVYKVVRSHIK